MRRMSFLIVLFASCMFMDAAAETCRDLGDEKFRLPSLQQSVRELVLSDETILQALGRLNQQCCRIGLPVTQVAGSMISIHLAHIFYMASLRAPCNDSERISHSG